MEQKVRDKKFPVKELFIFFKLFFLSADYYTLSQFFTRSAEYTLYCKDFALV